MRERSFAKLQNNKLSKFRVKKKPDHILSLAVFALAIFGLVMVASSSVIKSYQATDGASSYYYLTRQLISFGIGVFAWLIFQNIDYHFWKKHYIWIFLITIVLTLLVFMPKIGIQLGGAHRWMGFGSFLFQPSELLKLGFIIFLASFYDGFKDKVKSFSYGFLPFLISVAVIGVILIKQPDMGTAIIFLVIGIGMYLIANANLYYLLGSIPIFLIAFWILIKSSAYRMQRFLTFINPNADVLSAGYQINQSLIAIGSGGFWGRGYGNSLQKYNYLPEPMTDSIFAVIAEELGFFRSIFVLFLFFIIGWRGLKIAKNAIDDFGKLLATGITLWFVVQALVNLGAMMGLIPLTGVPLPFISYGGSSFIVNLAAVGILLNVSKYSQK